MKFIITIVLLLILNVSKAQELNLKTILTIAMCPDYKCANKNLLQQGFTFIKMDTTTLGDSIFVYTKGKQGDKKALTAEFELMQGVVVFTLRFLNKSYYTNLLKQLANGFTSRREQLSYDRKSYSTRYTPKKEKRYDLDMIRPKTPGDSERYAISVSVMNR